MFPVTFNNLDNDVNEMVIPEENRLLHICIPVFSWNARHCMSLFKKGLN